MIISFLKSLVIPDDEYETGRNGDNYYYHELIVDHTRIIGGSIVNMILKAVLSVGLQNDNFITMYLSKANDNFLKATKYKPCDYLFPKSPEWNDSIFIFFTGGETGSVVYLVEN